MSFNTNVCLDILTDNFDINTYFGLRRFENTILSETDIIATDDGYLFIIINNMNPKCKINFYIFHSITPTEATIQELSTKTSESVGQSVDKLPSVGFTI